MNTRIATRRALAVARLCAALALLGGCAKGQQAAKAPLTEHQRDSVLATEPVPGAATVGKALETSERAARDAAAMDSVAR